MNLEKFCEEIKGAYGDNLSSMILYGSAVSGDHSKKFSDINTLIVLKTLGLEQLRKISKVTNQWIKKGNPPPLMFTADGIFSSTDVFPMEFLDIKESHRVLYGDDIFKDLKIETKNLRLQCEHELRGKLIQLHESYILTGGVPKKVGELLIRSLSTFQVFFKSVLRIMGETVPARKREATKLLVTKLNLDQQVFDDIAGLRDNSLNINAVDMDILPGKYITEIRKVIDFVDKA